MQNCCESLQGALTYDRYHRLHSGTDTLARLIGTYHGCLHWYGFAQFRTKTEWCGQNLKDVIKIYMWFISTFIYNAATCIPDKLTPWRNIS